MSRVMQYDHIGQPPLFKGLDEGLLGDEEAECDANSDLLNMGDMEEEEEDDSSQQSRSSCTSEVVPPMDSNLYEVCKSVGSLIQSEAFHQHFAPCKHRKKPT